VWVDVLRDRGGARRDVLRNVLKESLRDEDVVLTRFNQLELLQGCRDEAEWGVLEPYLEAQDYLELRSDSWLAAARIYFDLRRKARTVRSPIDCCIAQVAIEHGALLLHRDHDFEAIAEIRPLRQMWVDWRR
jgi:predicted nucleic acid-binding protein